MVALVTPMHADGSVDWESLANLVEFHIDNQTDAIISVGTSGQSATLSHRENIEVIKRTLEIADRRIPIIAGTGSNSTAEAIEMTLSAKRVGADACLLVVPYYNKPSQEGLYQHYKAIAEAAAIPQILYNVPGRTVADLAHETTLRLSKIGNIIGIKDATADIGRGKALVAETADDFSVWSGDDATTLDLIEQGGQGCISVTANVAPKAMHQLCKAGIAGDLKAARAIDAKLRDLHASLFQEANPIPVTYAASKMGLMENNLRLPLTPLAQAFQQPVLDAMSEAGISYTA